MNRILFFSHLGLAGICLVVWPSVIRAQTVVAAPSFLTYVLVDNMTHKAQFYQAEEKLRSLPGFQRLDCRDFPPEFLIIYTSLVPDNSRIRKLLEEAGLHVFEVCSGEKELEAAIYLKSKSGVPRR